MFSVGLPMGFDIGFLPQFPVTSAQKNKASATAHPISKPEPVILCGGLLRLWETPAKVGL
jgi:hypothetical protein